MKARHEVCPQCGSKRKALIVNSRPHPNKRVRRRQCPTCKHRWDSYESFVDPDELPPQMRDRFTAGY